MADSPKDSNPFFTRPILNSLYLYPDRQAYFLGANDPYKSLRTSLKAESDKEAWDSLNSDTSRPFPPPRSGRIAVKVINHLGDQVMKVFRVKDIGK